MDGAVKSNLQQQINLLEKRLHWKIIGLRVALIFFIVLLEVVPYFQHYRMLDKWHSLPVIIRVGSYVALLLLQYYVGGIIIHKKFGSHIEYLKELVKEME